MNNEAFQIFTGYVPVNERSSFPEGEK